MTEADLTCQDLVELVTDYVEAKMGGVERLRFEEHLRCCPPCGTYMDQMRETIRLVGQLRCDDIPDEARDALLDAFRSWKRRA